MDIRIAGDVVTVAYHFDHRPGVCVDKASDVQRVFMGIDLHWLYPASLTSRREWRLPDEDAIGMRHTEINALPLALLLLPALLLIRQATKQELQTEFNVTLRHDLLYRSLFQFIGQR